MSLSELDGADPRFASFWRRFAQLALPPKRLAPSEWAETYRVLARESSAEPGRWRMARTPYLREPLDLLADPAVERIVLMFAAQTGKTDGLLVNGCCYFIDRDPANILVVQPREEDAKSFAKKRLVPTFRACPELLEKLDAGSSFEDRQTVLQKQFAGGTLRLAGSQSPAGLASDAIRILMLDEIDRFVPSTGAEGDPITIAEARTATYANRKILMTSTPTDEETSRIAHYFAQSDQRYYWVPCAHCGTFQRLVWSQVHWDRDAEGEHLPATARYVCVQCSVAWTDAARHLAVAQGQWRAEQPTGAWPGFHLNALYAPWWNLRLEALAARWVRSQGDPLQLKAFVNTVLAETWKHQTQRLDQHAIGRRREPYPVAANGQLLVPHAVTVLTAGVDVQDDRIEYQVLGWGADEECWACEYTILRGDPSEPAVWTDLWDHLIRPRQFVDGRSDYLRAIGVDTGHHTQRAYEFCKPRERVATPDRRWLYVFALRGMAGGKGKQVFGSIWPRTPSRRNKAHVPLYSVFVDPAKELIYSRISSVKEPGPGYVHFPAHASFGLEYYEQLAAEQQVLVHDRNGYPRMIWRLRGEGKRNEALDTFVYATVALIGLKTMGFDLTQEARLKELRPKPIMEPAPVAAEAAPPAVHPVERPLEPPRPQRRVQYSRWMQR